MSSLNKGDQHYEDEVVANPLKAPFPYFGGKGRAAAMVWSYLGDPGGYVEPFAGSAAVLLARPVFGGATC